MMNENKQKGLTLIKYAGLLGGAALLIFGLVGIFLEGNSYLIYGSSMISGLVMAGFGYGLSSYLQVEEEEKMEKALKEEEEKNGDGLGL